MSILCVDGWILVVKIATQSTRADMQVLIIVSSAIPIRSWRTGLNSCPWSLSSESEFTAKGDSSQAAAGRCTSDMAPTM